MVYLFNEHIPTKKTIKKALTAIHGIGANRALALAGALCFNPNKRFFTLGLAPIRKISKYIATNYKVGGILQKQTIEDIKKKIKIRCYQGIRHKTNLPVRGQRTHTNARTQKRGYAK